MSLFNLKELWAKYPEQDSEFCPNSFCVAEVNSSILLITGSLSGSLKVFCPAETAPNDDLLETSVGAPIYQIEYGNFVSGTATKQICILCPKSIKVFFLSYNPEDRSSSVPVSLEIAYEHRFERNSFNMVFGSFGQGARGRDFVCVQSVDGVLSVFEQETKGVNCNIPNFLLPSALVYLSSCDSFITASYSQTISAFKYQNFASEKIANKSALKTEWKYEAGELVVEMKFAHFEHYQPSVLVLGERSIVCLSDTGIVRFVKKLDCTPLCFFPYASLSKDSINYMVATSNSNLLILRDHKLIWTTQLPFAPIFLSTMAADNTENCISAADSGGNIIVGYLGTDPDLKSFISRLESRQNETYEKMQESLAVVKSSISGRELGIEQRDDSGDVLELIVNVASNLDNPSKAQVNNTRYSVPSITVNVLLKAKVAVTNVDILFSPVFPVATSQNQFNFPSAGCPKGESVTVDVVFHVEKEAVPSDLCVPVAASYKTVSGTSKTVHSSLTLPLNLCCTLCDPQKNQTHKLTLDFDRSPVPLPPLFSSFSVEDSNMENQNVVAFKFHNNSVVTILSGSKSNRYRLQADDFEALWLILKEFYCNMTAFIRDDKCLSFSGQLPVQELLSAIETHAQIRLNIFNLSELIGQRAVQFRVIQKRLLSKFKDKNADSLLNMDAILEGTYRQLVSLGDGAEEMEMQLVAAGCKVAAISKIVVFLCKMLQNLNAEEMKFLEYVFSPNLLFSAPLDQGWEEHVDAAVTHLLKTTMSKDSKEDGAQTVTLEKYPSPEKLTRHMKVFIDRILKGSCPSGASTTSSIRSFANKSHNVPSSQGHLNGLSSNTIAEEDEYEDTGLGIDLGAAGGVSRHGSSDDRSRKTSSGGLEHFESLNET